MDGFVISLSSVVRNKAVLVEWIASPIQDLRAFHVYRSDFGSPENFYTALSGASHQQPARADLHEAVNIMQARQFSAAGIRNFVDVIKETSRPRSCPRAYGDHARDAVGGWSERAFGDNPFTARTP